MNYFCSKRCLKQLFYTGFVKWQNFFKFSGYFGRKGSKQSGNSVDDPLWPGKSDVQNVRKYMLNFKKIQYLLKYRSDYN
jgi:hypothetical protein